MYVTRYNQKNQSRGLDTFNAFLDNYIQKQENKFTGGFMPTINTREAEDAYYVELDLPGIKKEDIDVDVKDNVITISGERKIQNEIDEEDYYSIESHFGKFERSFTLPENVNADKIQAQSKDGVLEVVIPKEMKKEDKPKKIKIK
jgi:HSP20 family protein